VVSVLITGFGPFPGAPVNPSAALARRLAARRRPVLAGTVRLAHLFRTSYAAVEAELPRLIAQHRPDVVLLFGLAGRTPYLRVETRAQNRLSLTFADVEGVAPPGASIRPGARALPGRAPFRRLVRAAQGARVHARLSRDAGRYLCNFAYWRALEETAGHARPPLIIFVHVPQVRARSRGGKRRFSMADLTRAGEAILIALVTAARRR
jgi:pyroglutamyl-peptidase